MELPINTLTYLPVCLASLFLIFRIVHFKKLQAHVKSVYPTEWKKLCVNKMGMNETTAKAANMEESLTSGFLSQQQDPVINNFRRKDKLLITIMVIFALLQLAIAFYK